MNEVKSFLSDGNIDFKLLFPEFTNSRLERELRKCFNQIGGNFTISGKRIENNFFSVKKGVICFKIKDPSILLNDLNKNKFIPITVRDYALLHQTHNKKTDVNNGLHFLTRKVVMDEVYDFSVVYFKKDYFKKIEGQERLIIIENKKIFDMVNLKSFFKYFPVVIEDNDLVLYGAGDFINSKTINRDFFSQFKDILYFGDYDDEGIDIFNLFSKYSSNSEFIVPLENEAKKVFEDMKAVGNKDGKLKIDSPIRKLLGYDFEIQQECFF